MLGRGPSRGGCKLSLQRFDSETETLPAFEPPGPSLSKEGSNFHPLVLLRQSMFVCDTPDGR